MQETFFTSSVMMGFFNFIKEIGLLNFFSPETGIQSIIAGFSNPVLVMENDESLTIKGIVPAKSLSSIVGETTDNNVTAEITILKKTHLMIKAKISGRLTTVSYTHLTLPTILLV